MCMPIIPSYVQKSQLLICGNISREFKVEEGEKYYYLLF